MVASHAPVHFSSGAEPHPAPVRPGSAVPSGPVVAGGLRPTRLVACAVCETHVPAATYCGACGVRLRPTHCDCGTDLPATACFCATCGAPV